MSICICVFILIKEIIYVYNMLIYVYRETTDLLESGKCMKIISFITSIKNSLCLSLPSEC